MDEMTFNTLIAAYELTSHEAWLLCEELRRVREEVKTRGGVSGELLTRAEKITTRLNAHYGD